MKAIKKMIAMRKYMVWAVSASLLLASCDTYTASGAYVGGSFGSILGSAIGGLSDGPRGSDVGTIVGMVGGAVVGAAIGNQADQQRQADLDQYHHDKAERQQARRQRQARQQADSAYGDEHQTYEQSGAQGSGFDSTNSGDDRIYDFNGSDYSGDYSAQQPVTTNPDESNVEEMTDGLSYQPNLVVRNARFVDDNQDGKLGAGEVCKIIFEVVNKGQKALFDVVPTVVETTGNRHIYISPSIHIEKIEPGRGIRYTAVVRADRRLKKGSARFCVSVVQGGHSISKVSVFNIPTQR